MAKLTISTIEAIVHNALVSKGYVAQDLDIVQRRADFVERVRCMALKAHNLTDEKLADVRAQADALNYEIGIFGVIAFSHSRSYFDVNIAGQTRRLYRSGQVSINSSRPEETTYRPMWAKDGVEYDDSKLSPFSGHQDFIVAAPAIREELDALNAEATLLRGEVDTTRATLKAYLRQFTTVEKLVKVWPEVVELLPPTVEKPVSNELALTPDDLNALCGLPK